MAKKITDLAAATTPIAGTELVEIVQGGVSKRLAASYLSGTIISGRELLTGARTYYVRTDGSDSNNGLAYTSGGAFLTIQKAVDVATSIDNNGYDVTISIGTGTFTGAVTLKSIVGNGSIKIRGYTADLTSTVISTTSADCISSIYFDGKYSLEYLKLQTTTAGYAIFLTGKGYLAYQNIAFGACANEHIHIENAVFVKATGNYTINGGATSHIASYDCAHFRSLGGTVTLSGTPALTTFFVAGRAGTAVHISTTFSGAATGKRYDVSLNAVVYTGGGATYFPGNSSGTTATGGQYA